ncbi:hypothetical protein [Brevundimonas sp.]
MLGSNLGLVPLAPRGAGGPPPLLSLDFVQGQYGRGAETTTTFTALSGVAFARAGSATALRADGGLAVFAADTPRITDRGLCIEPAATNRCAVSNANPDAGMTGFSKGGDAASTLTRVSAVSALAAAGLDTIATSGFLIRLNNSAGTAAATLNVSGAAGVAAAHSFSAWIGGGSGWIGRNGSNSQGFGASAVLRRVTGLNLTTTTSTTLAIQADAGQVIDVILPQLEIGAPASAPIVTTGAAATRGAESASVIAPAGATLWTATYGEGLTTGGSVTPGASFDLVTGRPWLGGVLKTLTMS